MMTKILLALMLSPIIGANADEGWPDLSSPARAVGGGENDAAVVVGVESYAFVPRVPGAESNAKAWYDYLTKTRGASAGKVKLLLNNDAAREDMLGAAQKAAAKAGPEGTLWYVFIGHGAPSADGKDGLLVGVDAQQKAESLQTHSLKRGELLSALGKSKAGKIVVVLDACFSGRGPDGSSLAAGLQPLVTVAAPGAIDARAVVLTAAKGDQFAGSLPGAQRPAFSYLVLGGLRGWAGQAKVTAGDLWRYASDALEATLRGRNQTPDLMGREAEALGPTAGEKGPDLAAMAKATAGGGGFQVTALPSVPKAEAPGAFGAGGGADLDFRKLDIDSLKKKSEAVRIDKSEAPPEEKAAVWRQLGQDVPGFSAIAEKRAADWDRFAAEKKAAEEAERRRAEARDADWEKLSQLLSLEDAVVPEASKKRWSAELLKAYMKSPGIEPEMAKGLLAFAELGQTKKALADLASKAGARAPAPKSGGYLGANIKDAALAGVKGAEAVDVASGSPADAAGLRGGDVIVAVNGEAVESANSLAAMVRGLPPGRSVTLLVLRGGGKLTLATNLGARPKAANGSHQPSASEGDQRDADGLSYVELRAGQGGSPEADSTVRVNYRGTLADGIVFDDSYKRGQPAEFPLRGVIPCWTEALQKMRVGGKARIVCPPRLAYGSRGAPPTIPGGATLTFEVELLGIEK